MTVVIDKKIVGYAVKSDKPEKQEKEEIKIHKRPFQLKGSTYKVKPPNSDSAIYMTVNDICINNKWQPYEIFLNSRHMESYPWISLVTRLVSAIFRTERDSSFIINEFESIFDPSNGYFGKVPGKKKGKYYESYIAELGAILRLHMENLGSIKPVLTIKEEQDLVSTPPQEEPATTDEVGPSCPECGEPNMKLLDGCWTCVNGCAYSKCS